MSAAPERGPEPPESVLERNLRLLFARAYSPVVARESFRVALERDLRAHVASRRRPRPAPAWRTPLWIAAAAGVALALGLLLRHGPSGPEMPLTPERILASGHVAVREGTEAWRAVEARPAGAGLPVARIEASSPPLELATPERAQAMVELAQAALRVGPSSSVSLRDEGSGQLARGSLEVESRGSAPFRSSTSEGEIELLSGRAALAYVEPPRWADEASPGPWVAVELSEGAALVSDRPAPRRIEAPHSLHLRAGRIETEPGVPTEAASDPRRALSVPEPPAAAEVPAEAEPPAVLRGVVRAQSGIGPGGAPILVAVESFRLLLLEDVRLPDTSEPIVIEVEHPEGRFAIGPQEPGTYTLFIQAAGQATWKREGLELGAAPPAGQEPQMLEVRLDAGLSVRGQVVDARTGVGVPGAVVLSETDAPLKVLALDPAGLGSHGVVRFVVTDANGGFELEHVARGPQVLRASDGGLSVVWSERLELAGSLPLAGLELRLPPGGGIEGYVRDEHGEPRAGAPLVASCVPFGEQRTCISYKFASTDAEGYYKVEGLPRGSIAVLLFHPVEGGDDVTPDMQLAMVEPGKLTRIDFAPAPQSLSLSGRLLDLEDRPIAGLSVWIAPTSSIPSEMDLVSTTTRADGGFDFEGLEPGSHELFLSGREPGDVTWLEQVVLAPGAPAFVELRAGAATIAGHVRAPSRGGPAAAVLILNESASQRFAGKVATAADGSFQLERLRPGLYDLHAYPLVDGLAPARIERIAVSGGEGIQGLELELGPGGSALILVRDEAGQPLEGAHVVCRDVTGRRFEFSETPFSDAAGRYRVPGVGPGPWTALVELEGFAPAAQPFEVAVGAESSVTITLRRAEDGR